MLKALLRTQLSSVLASLTRSSKGTQNTSRASTGIVLVIILIGVGLIAFACGMMFDMLAAPLHEAGLDWFYFAIGALSAFALSFIGSVFTAQQQLFNARDNELLLAMPIPPRLILGSRMATLLVLNYALELVMLIPVGIVWGMNVGFSATGLVGFVVCLILLPLLVLTFTCLIAWILAAVSSRMRNKTIITMALYLLFLAAYFYIYMNFSNLLNELVANGAALAGGMSAVYPIYAFGQAAAAGDLLAMGGFALCCIIPFAIVYIILSAGFLSVTTRRPAAKKLVYRERRLAVSSASSALFKKELAHFGSNGMYILNASMGSILTIAAAIALIIYRDTVSAVLALLPEGWTSALMVMALCFLCGTDVISAPSISLEGKTLWLLKSLPVTPRVILMSKVKTHVAVALPVTLIASVCCILALTMTPLECALVIVIPALMTLFGALLGVVVNLRFPKFDYINETAVIKNSMAVMITMFASWGVLAAPVALYVVLLDNVIGMVPYMCLCAVALAAACAAMYVYLGRGGAKRFAQL